jgi:hypothetical protein
MGAAKLLTAGGGGITLDAASTATDKTVTIPARTGNVAIDGPAFNAYSSGAQSITASTWTKITFDSERFDTNSNFASSRFQPTVAGYYLLTSSAYFSANPSIAIMIISINGAGSTGYDVSRISTSGAGTIGGSMMLYLNGSTDYAEIYFYSGNANTLGIASNSNFVAFSGAMVRGA